MIVGPGGDEESRQLRIDCGKEERIGITEKGKEQLEGAEKQKGAPEGSKSRVTSAMWFLGEGRRNRSLIRRQSRWPWRKETSIPAQRKSQDSHRTQVQVWILVRQ